MENNQITILAIDDLQDNLITLKAIILEAFPDAKVLVSTNGKDAINLAISHNPDVVLLDIVMPDLDGFEVCKFLKADDVLRDIPIVFVTALKDDRDSRIKALSFGAEGFLAKPVDSIELTAQIRAMIKIKNANNEKRNEVKKLNKLVDEKTAELKKTYTATLNLLEDLHKENEARKKVEESLNEAQFIAEMGSWEWDLTTNIIAWSDGQYRLYGEDKNKFVPTFEDYLIHLQKYDVNRLTDLIKKDPEGIDSFTDEHEIILPNGSRKFISVSGKIVYDGDGKAIKMKGISQDITQRKHTENRLKYLARLYSFLSSVNETIINSKNLDLFLSSICKIAIEVGGFRFAWIGVADESTGLINPMFNSGFGDGYLDIVSISSEDIPTGKGPTGTSIRTKKATICNDIANNPVMLPWRNEALQRGYKSSAALPFMLDNKSAAVLTLYSGEKDFFNEEEVDLIEKIRAAISFAIEALIIANEKEKAQQKLLQLSRAVEQSPASIVITDTLGNIEYVNPKFVEVTGYSMEEATGKNPRILKSGYTRQDDYKLLWETITEGKEWRGEFKNVRKDGSKYWEYAVISPIVNTTGEIINFLAVKEDITERKRTENEKVKITNDMVRHINNLEQFAYIVSHNLRAPIANILGLNDLLKAENLEEHEIEFCNQGISKSVERLDEIVNDLNNILQVKNELNNRKESVIFKTIVEDILESIKNLVVREKLNIILNFKKAESIVSIKSYVYSIFYNLISNSIKYSKKDVLPIIEINSEIIGEKVIISYKDNGIGIDLKKRGNDVFGLYKRFHTDYAQGKGIGLFMVKSQVENLGGDINIQSEPGIGTEFKIELPL